MGGISISEKADIIGLTQYQRFPMVLRRDTVTKPNNALQAMRYRARLSASDSAEPLARLCAIGQSCAPRQRRASRRADRALAITSLEPRSV